MAGGGREGGGGKGDGVEGQGEVKATHPIHTTSYYDSLLTTSYYD